MATERIRRKDLKKPDEFITLSGQALTWIGAHTRTVTWIGVGLVGILAVIGISLAFESARQRDANADLAQAMAAMRANDLSQAATEFTEVRERWGSTTPGELAAVLAAGTNLRLGNPDAALTAIQSASGASGLPDYLRQQLTLLWGVALEQKGDWPGAIERFHGAAEMNGPYTADAILGEARAHEHAGDAERARELYRKYYDQFPEALDRELIKAKAGITGTEAAPDAAPPPVEG